MICEISVRIIVRKIVLIYNFFFFLFFSKDHAGHSNDAAAHAHDILAYFDAVKVAQKYVDEHPDTILVSTADHECGGFSLAREPDYIWYINLVYAKVIPLLILV